MKHTKYPSTKHFDFSPGLTRGDTVIEYLDMFQGKRIVVSEKIDGENTTMYTDHLHARSLDSRNHPSRNWVKSFHGSIAHLINPNHRICGENVYAKHSIYYTELLSYFYGFSVWDIERNTALSWDDTIEVFDDLGIISAPVLYRGDFSLKVLVDLAVNLDIEHHEGFVVRIEDEIPFDQFDVCVAKWVRPGHVQTDEHWSHGPVVPNLLKGI